MSDNKFLKKVKEYFGVEAKEIKSIINELEKANGDTDKLILTEQFNLGFTEGLKESAKQLGNFFEENMKQPIQDFKEIDPSSTVEDIVVTDKITDGK